MLTASPCTILTLIKHSVLKTTPFRPFLLRCMRPEMCGFSDAGVNEASYM